MYFSFVVLFIYILLFFTGNAQDYFTIFLSFFMINCFKIKNMNETLLDLTEKLVPISDFSQGKAGKIFNDGEDVFKDVFGEF